MYASSLLQALAGWVAEGYVHELHLSDLMGKVPCTHVFVAIHCKFMGLGWIPGDPQAFFLCFVFLFDGFS